MASSTVWQETLARLKGQLDDRTHGALSASRVIVHSGRGLVEVDVEPETTLELSEDDERAVLDALSLSARNHVAVRVDRRTTDRALGIGENRRPPSAVAGLHLEIEEDINAPSIGENDRPPDL
jgi:hypothetical protein